MLTRGRHLIIVACAQAALASCSDGHETQGIRAGLSVAIPDAAPADAPWRDAAGANPTESSLLDPSYYGGFAAAPPPQVTTMYLLAAGTDCAFYAEAVAVSASSNGRDIFTRVTLGSIKQLYGSIAPDTVTFRGGQIGDAIQIVEGYPTPTVGDRYIVFMHSITGGGVIDHVLLPRADGTVDIDGEVMSLETLAARIVNVKQGGQ